MANSCGVTGRLIWQLASGAMDNSAFKVMSLEKKTQLTPFVQKDVSGQDLCGITLHLHSKQV